MKLSAFNILFQKIFKNQVKKEKRVEDKLFRIQKKKRRIKQPRVNL